MSIDEIVEKVISEILKQVEQDKTKPQSFYILSPAVRDKKGEFKDLFDNLQSKGYQKVIIDGKEKNLSDDINLIKTNKHKIDVSIDRLIATNKDLKQTNYFNSFKSRLRMAVEQSLKLSDGLVIIKTDYKEHLYSEKFSCPICNLSLPEIEPRMFSFNSPLGACENCRGIGTIHSVDKNLILNKNLSILEGGILPFNKLFFHETWYVRLLKKAVEEEGINLNKQIKELTNDEIKIILYGTGKVYKVPGLNRYGKETVIFEKFDGVIPELERRYYNASGDWAAAEIQKYMREEICPTCKGAKLKKEVLAVTLDGKNISELSNSPIDSLASYFVDKLPAFLSSYEGQIAKPILKEILTRLKFLNNVGLSYLTIARVAKTLSGGEL